MDFVADNLFDGRKLRMLTVVDCCSRESPAIHVGQSLKGEGVAVLSATVAQRGKPQTIKSDKGIELDFSRPGKPTDNAMVESFNGQLCQEYLNEH